MLMMVLSPAKTLDFDTPPHVSTATQPRFVEEAKQLADGLRRLTPAQIGSLMSISDKLAALNAARWQQWQPTFTPQDSKQAVLAFHGDVYEGLDAATLSAQDLQWAQDHLRILSGLYGLLRPLDLIRPYRLEMGTAWPNPRGKDLYAFWGTRLAEQLDADMAAGKGEPILLNLASEEYFKAIDRRALKARVVQAVFQDRDAKGQYKVISFFAKRARGLMARYVITHRLQSVDALTAFDSEGYRWAPAQSSADMLVFRREAKPH